MLLLVPALGLWPEFLISFVHSTYIEIYIYNHTFPEYLVSTLLILDESTDIHTDRESEKLPLTTLPTITGNYANYPHLIILPGYIAPYPLISLILFSAS